MRDLPGQGVADDEIELGYVSGIFGVRGEVRLFLHNPESDLLAKPRRVVLVAPDGRRYEAKLAVRSGAGKRVIGAIDGLTDRDRAEGLMEWRIAIAEADLPDPEEDEFYVHAVIGLPVLVGERPVGHVAAVHPTAAGDLLEIDTGTTSEFVPLLERFVLEISADGVVLADDALDEGEA